MTMLILYLCIQSIADLILLLSVFQLWIFHQPRHRGFIEHVFDTIQKLGSVSKPVCDDVATPLIVEFALVPPLFMVNLNTTNSLNFTVHKILAVK